MTYDGDELDDAIIEDTIHCDLCGSSWTCGDDCGGVCIESPRPIDDRVEMRLPKQLKLCMNCAMQVTRAYQLESQKLDQCSHGVALGEICADCNREHQQARKTI